MICKAGFNPALFLPKIYSMIQFIARGINYVFGGMLGKKSVFLGASLNFLNRKRKIDRNYFDYIRLAALELISHEINSKKLSGNVAELGVYKGKFARYINQYFPGRTLYLFDTFEGFDKRDTDKEVKENFSTGEQDFSNTSVEAVLSIMPHRELCKPVKGFFPESANGFDDQVVFVSIDADLYEPIYAGLVFFYPRLVKGGCIFVHDFNNDSYKGARKAVEQFCSEQQIGFVPLPDSGGTAIITK
jgi:O-methyltransferase